MSACTGRHAFVSILYSCTLLLNGSMCLPADPLLSYVPHPFPSAGLQETALRLRSALSLARQENLVAEEGKVLKKLVR